MPKKQLEREEGNKNQKMVSWAPTESIILRKSVSGITKTADRSRWIKLNRFCGLVKRNPCRFGQKKKAFDDDGLYWKGSKMKLENKVSRGCNWSKFTSMRKKVG